MPIAAPTGAGNVTTAVNGAANTVSISKPSNVADGDLLVAFVSFRNSGGTITTPAGWTALNPVNTTNETFSAYYKTVPTASAETAVTYAFSSSAGSSRAAGTIFRLTGADLTSVQQVAGALAPYTGTTSVVLPSVTATKAGGLLAFAMDNVSTTGAPAVISAPSGMTLITQASADNGSSSTMSIMAAFQLVDIGTTGSKTAAISPTAANSAGMLMVLNQTAPPVPDDLLVVIGNVTTEPAVPVTLTATVTSSSTITGGTWTQTGGPALVLAPSGLSVTFTPPAALANTSYTLRYAATDVANHAASGTSTVAVLAATERAVLGGVEVPMLLRTPNGL